MRALLLVALCVVAYWNSFSNPLIMDDRVVIAENQEIRDLTELGRVLSPRRESPVAGRPLVSATLAVNYALGGSDPFGYRLANLAIHVACALLLMGALRHTLAVSKLDISDASALDFSWAVALLWAVHPLNSEVIDYLTQRTESLMALCLFATLYSSMRAHTARSPRSWQCAAVVMCALGMACKESMVVAPVLVFLCDAYLIYSSPMAALRARAGFYGGLALTWAGLAWLNWWGPRMRSAGFSTAVGPWTYLLNQAPIIADYLWLSVWPRALVAMYGAPVPLTVADVWAPGLAIVVLLLATVVALWRRSWLGVAGAWFFVALSPASSMVPIATEVGAERRMYVPLVAVLSLAVYGAWQVARRWELPSSAARATLGLVCALLMMGTVVRNAEYVTLERLAGTVLDRRPSSEALHMMGEGLLDAGRDEEAMPFLREAISGSPRAQYALGVVLFNRGRHAEAYQELVAFVRREPLLLEVVTARLIMGKVLALERRWPEAVAELREVLRMNPAEPEAPGLLAQALLSAEDYEAAVEAYRVVLAGSPDNLDARCNLGVSLVGAGRAEEGIAAFAHNIERNPNHLPSRINLAMALFDLRRPDEALPHAQQAVALDPQNPERHDFLGRVFAVQGRLADAKGAFERALSLDAGHAGARENLVRLTELARAVGAAR